MYAITPHGIGKKVGARAIEPGWDLLVGEAFTIETFTIGLVLAEDGISLRQPTARELAPTYQELRLAGYGLVQDQLDEIYWDKMNATTTWQDRITKVKVAYPKT